MYQNPSPMCDLHQCLHASRENGKERWVLQNLVTFVCWNLSLTKLSSFVASGGDQMGVDGFFIAKDWKRALFERSYPQGCSRCCRTYVGLQSAHTYLHPDISERLCPEGTR
jgi:hypothetical protein